MKYLYMNKYWSVNKEYDFDKILYLMIDRPNYISGYCNDFIWTNNKSQHHRDYDFPSSVCFYSNKKHITLYWDINNLWHREKSKPAYICYNGDKAYYMYDCLIKREKQK